MSEMSPGQRWGILGLLLLVIVVAAGAALPGRETIDVGDPLPQDWYEQLSAETGRVASKHATGGFAFLGMQIAGKTYLLDVHFLASPDCTGSGASDSTPVTCDGPDGLTGEPAGLTPDGDVIVTARVEVSGRCYDVTEIADIWPPAAECTPIPTE